jgi:hypothetical protein
LAAYLVQGLMGRAATAPEWLPMLPLPAVIAAIRSPGTCGTKVLPARAGRSDMQRRTLRPSLIIAALGTLSMLAILGGCALFLVEMRDDALRDARREAENLSLAL